MNLTIPSLYDLLQIVQTLMLQIIPLAKDEYIFPLFEFCYVALVTIAFLKDKGIGLRKTGVLAVVKRGEQSRKNFYLAYGFASVILIQIINSTETLKYYKTIINLLNLSTLCYMLL